MNALSWTSAFERPSLLQGLVTCASSFASFHLAFTCVFSALALSHFKNDHVVRSELAKSIVAGVQAVIAPAIGIATLIRTRRDMIKDQFAFVDHYSCVSLGFWIWDFAILFHSDKNTRNIPTYVNKLS